jgi:hypothetical protein
MQMTGHKTQSVFQRYSMVGGWDSGGQQHRRGVDRET